MRGSMPARMVRVVLSALAALLFVAAPGFAQSTATLQGTATDTQGAVMPGVTITIHNEQTGTTRVVVSDGTGSYQAAALPPGRYTVTAHLEGFRDQVEPVDLAVAQTVAVAIKLAVGGIAEKVDVAAAAQVIDTTTTSVGMVISQRTVQEIPLNGRHFVDLGLLIPGSVTPPQNGFLTAPLRGQGSFAINTAGNREDTVNFMINGVNLNDMAQNQITFQPSINTVSEFKVDNSTFSAEYGRNSGAIVNIATRSGSNDLHGEGFEFYRNDALDSRNFFNQPPVRQSPFNRNQFGANFGGPIAKNRLFFFGSYEGLRQRQGLDVNSGVLSDAQRAGVTDPVSLKLLQFIPAANGVDANGGARFVGSATAPVNIDQGTADVSYSSGQNALVHGYYAWQRDQRGEPLLQGDTVPDFGDTRHSHRQIMTLNESHVFGPSLVNEARFGFNRIGITFSPVNVQNPSDFGINDGITSSLALPQITIQGPALTIGGPAGFPQGRTDTSFVVSDTASYLRGNHSIKFGGEWRRFSNTNFTSDPGSFTYPSVAGFQSGLGSAFAITLGNRPSDIIEGSFGAFVRDNFRASSKVTIEAGLRYDLNMAPTDAGNRYVVFNAANDTLRQLGAGEKIYGNSNNLEPRVGVIYTPASDGRTVVRGAYAIMVDQPVTNVVTPTTANPPVATPLAVSGNVRLDSALATALASGLAPQSVDPNFNSARLQTYNINVERQVGPSLGLMVGYFGSKGDRMRISRNLNQLVNGVKPFPTLSATSPILPGGALGNITEITDQGISHYNALWITANERPMKRLQFNASYTFAKSTDYNSLNSQGIVVQDSTNLAGDLGPSDFDVRHRFVISAIYDLPFKGNRAVEGWQVGLVTQAQTGNPINVLTNINTFTGTATLRPDLVGDPAVIGSSNQWFNNSVCDPRIAGSCTSSSVFALPVSASGAVHFGNLPRNAIVGPGFGNTDLSLVKNVGLRGSAHAQVRIEAFNVFNQANFGQPGRTATVGSTSFGVITNTRFATGDSGSSRQVQVALKLLF
jgi:hypothetical protein